MTTSAATVLSASNVGDLNTQIAAAIAAGATEIGSVNHMGGKWIATMLTERKQIVYSADGAIDPLAGTAVLTKGSAAAMTLAAPSVAQNGLKLRIVSSSAFAHVITATNLIEDGITGGPKDTITFTAFKGASIDLEAYAGTWHAVGSRTATIAAV